MRRAFVCCLLLPPYTLLATCTIRAGRPYIAVNAGAQCRLHDGCRRGSAPFALDLGGLRDAALWWLECRSLSLLLRMRGHHRRARRRNCQNVTAAELPWLMTNNCSRRVFCLLPTVHVLAPRENKQLFAKGFLFAHVVVGLAAPSGSSQHCCRPVDSQRHSTSTAVGARTPYPLRRSLLAFRIEPGQPRDAHARHANARARRSQVDAAARNSQRHVSVVSQRRVGRRSAVGRSGSCATKRHGS